MPQSMPARARGLPGARLARAAVLAALSLAAALPAAHAGCQFKRTAVIPLQWSNGVPHIDGAINGKPVEMVVATGTSGVVLPSGLADELGLVQRHADVEWVGSGGRVQGYDTRVEEIRLGSIAWHRTWLPVANRPADRIVEVGATFLLQADLEMSAQALGVFVATDCGDAPLAYWADGVPFVETESTSRGDHRIFITVRIDGQPVRALVDSARAVSVLDLAAARRLGFDERAAPSTAPAGAPPTWQAAFDTFAIDEETVRHPQLAVADVWGRLRHAMDTIGGARYVGDQPELLLGADFLAAHRILIARSQRRLYLSYVGGPLFNAPARVAGAPAAP